MRNFTPLFAMGVLAAATMPAAAETSFQQSDFVFNHTTHRSAPFVADLTNNNHFDIFFGGQGDDVLGETGCYWQMLSTLYLNQGDNNFEFFGLEREAYQQVDEEGNPLYDEEGNPQMGYNQLPAPSGILPTTGTIAAAIDYNNDGLLDVLLYGRTHEWDIWLPEEEKAEGNRKRLILYKNLGNGKFEVVPDAVFPQMQSDHNYGGTGIYPIAVGDFDRDGFVDFCVAGTELDRDDEHQTYPGRAFNLYRNVNGTGVFEDMKIAETKGGVWTSEVKDDEGNVIEEKQELKGWFLPVSGNVHMVDINNDGWLDLVYDGWVDANYDGVHGAGSTLKIYLNQEGQKFVDATPMSSTHSVLRSSASNVADFNNDGYFDYFQTGWSDNGYGWNAFLSINDFENGTEDFFTDIITSADLGLDGTEGCRQVVRDFDNDGYLDILYAGQGDNNGESKNVIYYGSMMGNFEKGSAEGMNKASAGGAACADFNGNGLSDYFACGYGGIGLYYNQGEAAEAPEAPQNVAVEIVDGKLVITWDYDTDAALEAGLAYNVAVKTADGKIYSLVPADFATGFVKVSEGREVALRPNVTEYSMVAPGENLTVGVQAISLKNETYSAFATAELGGILGVTAETATLNVKVNGDAVTVEGVEGAVNVYDVTGRKVATGFAGEAINVAGNGVFVVSAANATAKIVK